LTNDRAASRVGCINSLQSLIEDGSLFCFDNERGISLGQHVLPPCLFCSSVSISCFNIALDIDVVDDGCVVVVSVKYFDLVFLLVVVLLSAFRFLFP